MIDSSTTPSQPWNIVVVVADTLRTAYIGAYGNDWIQTPNLDRFAGQSVRFTCAHAECLPTIPTRRTLHSGRRAFPFADYRPVPWDNVYIPGWQPLSPDEPTVAESLVERGYHTGFYADVPHYFVPGMNFTRGFRQWQFVRGQAEDRYRATAHADAALLSRYVGSEERIRAHLVNVQPQRPEETWPTARTFRAAIEFIEQNDDRRPFYLYVDSFTPHETWEAPLHYYDLYGTREEREPMSITVPYGPLDDHPHIEARLPSIRANYAGLVTMVDTWFGRLVDTLDRRGLGSNTVVVFLSDHGTNFADNPEGVTGKPANAMYPGTMSIPLLLRHPQGDGAGRACDELVYTLDVPATVLDVAGARTSMPLDGQSLLPLTGDGAGFQSRQYLTCRYGNSLWYRDRKTWCFGDIGVERSLFRRDLTLREPRLFDLESDPECTHNIAATAAERVALARDRLITDAGGHIMPFRRKGTTDAIGRPEFESE